MLSLKTTLLPILKMYCWKTTLRYDMFLFYNDPESIELDFSDRFTVFN